jgi:hypothetical protein
MDTRGAAEPTWRDVPGVVYAGREMRKGLLKAFAGGFTLVWLTLTVGDADQEAGNRSYVAASASGQFYAKSVPHEPYGLKGSTRIYQVGDPDDVLLHTYDWYTPQIFLEGFLGTRDVYVVETGPWHRGAQASPGHLALAFHKNGTLVRQYSTLEIAGRPENVSASVSHYVVFRRLAGFRRPYGNQLVFDVELHDGRALTFDVDTGAMLSRAEEAFRKQIYDAEVRVEQIKWKWYEANRTRTPNPDGVVITEQMLRAVAPPDFPQLPAGYRYVPDTMWRRARFEK